MLSRKKHSPQLGLFHGLADQLDQKHPLYLLANKINWSFFDEAFKVHYSEKMGKPAKPIRLMVSLLILKYVRNLSDENLVDQWAENIYYQYLSGEQHFQAKIPCVPTELIAFRQRIGEAGVELILKESIRINGKDGKKDNLSGDTTVHEKNITYPTDRKLYERTIEHCKRIAKTEGISLKRTYTREIKKLKYQLRFARGPKNVKKLIKAQNKLHRIAIKIYNDLVTQLNPIPKQEYYERFNILYRVLTQVREDKNKVYSIHEPEVLCIAKGKEHKPYEFGNKSSFAYTRKSGIIVGALAIEGNMFDGHTLEPQLDQVREITDGKIRKAIVDRGYRGKLKIGITEIVMPNAKKKESYYLKKQREARCRSRAGIEGLISHLKHDHRLMRNYLKGNAGDGINTLLAASAYNMMKWMKMKRKEFFVFIFRWFLLAPKMVLANIQLSRTLKKVD